MLTKRLRLQTKNNLLFAALKFFNREGFYWTKIQAIALEKQEKQFWEEAGQKVTLIYKGKKSKAGITKIIRSCHQRVVFSSHLGTGPRPIIADRNEEDDTKYPRWIESSADGGFTKTELLDWLELHHAEINDACRAHLRVEREGKYQKELALKAHQDPALKAQQKTSEEEVEEYGSESGGVYIEA